MNLSAVVLTLNEENRIGNCLDSLRFATEIIVVDNGSTDKTLSVVRKYTDKIHKFAGTDFSGARGLGAVKAKYGWVLYVDADEIVTPELVLEIKTLDVQDFAAFTVTRINHYYGKRWPQKDETVRLIRKKAFLGWTGKVHETPRLEGNIGRLENPILHYTHSDIAKMVEKTNLWSETEAGLRLESNHPEVKTWRLLRIMLTEFSRSFFVYGGYKMGTLGFIEGIYQAFSGFITYSKLWELQQKEKKS